MNLSMQRVFRNRPIFGVLGHLVEVRVSNGDAQLLKPGHWRKTRYLGIMAALCHESP